MKPAEIIHEVTLQGGHIGIDADRLKLSAPRPLPDELLDEIRQHKQAVIETLSRPRLTVVTCRHCGAQYWHHLGHMAEGGKIAGGPCCFGHPVLTVSKYPTEAKAQAAWGKWQGARTLPDTQKAVTGEMVAPI